MLNEASGQLASLARFFRVKERKSLVGLIRGQRPLRSEHHPVVRGSAPKILVSRPRKGARPKKTHRSALKSVATDTFVVSLSLGRVDLVIILLQEVKNRLDAQRGIGPVSLACEVFRVKERKSLVGDAKEATPPSIRASSGR